MTFEINTVGGGWMKIQLDAEDLQQVPEHLRRERSLIGLPVATEANVTVIGNVLIPAQRIAMISET
jgi:hypothetical protein